MFKEVREDMGKRLKGMKTITKTIQNMKLAFNKEGISEEKSNWNKNLKNSNKKLKRSKKEGEEMNQRISGTEDKVGEMDGSIKENLDLKQ